MNTCFTRELEGAGRFNKHARDAWINAQVAKMDTRWTHE